MLMTIVRSALAVIVGYFAGSIVNIGLILFGMLLIPPPEGMNVMDPESIAANAHLFESRHFIFPFLAHASGALVGAVIAFFIAGYRRPLHAYVIGALFLLGGVYAATTIPSPTWFVALDLIVAYIPMAWLATKIGGRFVDPNPG